MSVTWRGIDEFLSGLDEFADDVSRLPELEEAGDAVRERAAAQAPRRTGELAGSGQVLVREDTVNVFFTSDHAAPIIVGVPSHNIEPHPFPEAALREQEGAITVALERGVEDAVRRAGL